mgnify:FL=1|tara:strand:- start:191 stop:628 length:438 start_codon:yes stop_codon:yes gene_type:complete
MSKTEYIEGDHNDFIRYLFSDSPKEKGTITLELPLLEPNKNIGLHVFEQLLMIFVDGLKYFYGENDKVDINRLTKEDIQRVNEYFLSMDYAVKLEYFPTMNEYQFKFPNYFKNQDKITNDTLLEDFFYETFNERNSAFRISFSKV